MTDRRFMPDELANRLDAALPPSHDTIPAVDDDALVNLAIQLARTPRPEMAPETFARIQAQVIQAHRRQQPIQRPALRLPMTPLMRWAAIFVIAVFFFGSAMIPAAASSLPGELLYSVKLGIEQIEVIAAPSPIALSVVHLNHAERRLSEAQILLERGQFESTLLIAGWESLARSAEKAEEAPSADIPFDLQARAAQVNVALNAVLLDAEQSGIVSTDEIRNIRVNVVVADDNTPTPVPTLEPSASPTAIPMETSGSTLVAVPTSTPVEEIVVNIPATDDEPEELSDTSTSTGTVGLSADRVTRSNCVNSVLKRLPYPVEASTHLPTATRQSPTARSGIDRGCYAHMAYCLCHRGVNVRRGQDKLRNHYDRAARQSGRGDRTE
jgi:hypothetical protein